MKHLFLLLCSLSLCISMNAQVFGAVYHQRLDDLAWENEYCAFRAYGPALQKKGEKSYGYDIWVKNTSDTIVDLRYRLHFPPKGTQRKSFHLNWGNGMDCYVVGSSLGCCTAALLDDNGKIIYPWCWSKCDIKENGPKHFVACLTYTPTFIYNNDSTWCDTITEHRIITVEKGNRFNKCEVWYEGLHHPRKLAVGIVVHKENTDTLSQNLKKHYMAYVDLQDPTMCSNPDKTQPDDKGVIYIGAYSPQFTEMKQDQGHLLAITTLQPSQHLTYYFGATWSKFDVHSFKQWKKIMTTLSNPLPVH